MIEILVPGKDERIEIAHLVLDFNGTLAQDGKIKAGVGELLGRLSRRLSIHILTAGTFGDVEKEVQAFPCELKILSGPDQTAQKGRTVEALGTECTVAIGNGRNDMAMLKKAKLGILVIQEEGAATEALLAADIVCTDIIAALNLLLQPLRLTATLRT
ncbi:MAG TPA: HAD hydrolase family protein [Candidatus Binatia bacterium]|nr:HAD hydrolase family protein [Candidatus Binatia bacterium]